MVNSFLKAHGLWERIYMPYQIYLIDVIAFLTGSNRWCILAVYCSVKLDCIEMYLSIAFKDKKQNAVILSLCDNTVTACTILTKFVN